MVLLAAQGGIRLASPHKLFLAFKSEELSRGLHQLRRHKWIVKAKGSTSQFRFHLSNLYLPPFSLDFRDYLHCCRWRHQADADRMRQLCREASQFKETLRKAANEEVPFVPLPLLLNGGITATLLSALALPDPIVRPVPPNVR